MSTVHSYFSLNQKLTYFLFHLDQNYPCIEDGIYPYPGKRSRNMLDDIMLYSIYPFSSFFNGFPGLSQLKARVPLCILFAALVSHTLR